MSKKDKLLSRLTGKPAPKDFPWSDLVTVMERAGFSCSCKGGSHHTFEHTSGYSFVASRAHPGGILKAYQVKEAVDALEKVGALNREEENG